MGRIAEGKSPTLCQLRPHHRTIARMMVAEGARPGEIAKVFGFSPAQVTVIINSPLFIAEVNRLEAQADYEAIDVRNELEQRQGLAISAIDKALLQADADKAARVGFEILDRTGYGKRTEPQKHLHLHAHREVSAMSDEDLLKDVMEIVAEEG